MFFYIKHAHMYNRLIATQFWARADFWYTQGYTDFAHLPARLSAYLRACVCQQALVIAVGKRRLGSNDLDGDHSLRRLAFPKIYATQLMLAHIFEIIEPN